jgi:phosphohistidine phosphatase
MPDRRPVPSAKQLYVLRHAKSSWDDSRLEDHERPLSARGRRAARLIGSHLRSEAIVAELVLCSAAQRTRETLAAAGIGGEVVIDPELYAASASGVLERLRRVPPQTASVMLIGHNPTLQILTLRLAAREDDPLIDAVREKFPTGALATLAVGCGWRELDIGAARLTSFIRPRDLENGESGPV